MQSLTNDSNSYSCPSLGLGNPAGAGILEGDVLGALKIEQHVGAHDSSSYCRPSLGLGSPARADSLDGDVWGALKSQHDVGTE